jgi:hypothetical protein
MIRTLSCVIAEGKGRGVILKIKRVARGIAPRALSQPFALNSAGRYTQLGHWAASFANWVGLAEVEGGMAPDGIVEAVNV